MTESRTDAGRIRSGATYSDGLIVTSETDRNITVALAEKAMGWRAGSDRFLTGERYWIRRSEFQPLKCSDDALGVVEATGALLAIKRTSTGIFTARVQIGQAVATVSSDSMARAITLAIARALGIYAVDEPGPAAASRGCGEKP